MGSTMRRWAWVVAARAELGTADLLCAKGSANATMRVSSGLKCMESSVILADLGYARSMGDFTVSPGYTCLAGDQHSGAY